MAIERKPLRMRAMVRPALLAAALLGVLVGTLLVAWYGIDAVGDAFLAAGWQGLALVCLLHLLPLWLCGAAWYAASAGRGGEADSARTPHYVLARWIRDAVGGLIGMLPIAGEAVGARILALHGVRPALAGAVTVVDVTAETLSQVPFTILGVALLAVTRPGSDLLWWAGVALATAAPAFGLVLAVGSKRLLGWLQALAEMAARSFAPHWRDGDSFDDGEATLAERVRALLRCRRGFLSSVALHFAAWVIATAEAWAALWAMGHPIGLAEAVALESLMHALRGIAFMVPWSAGVQEGGYVAVGALFGVGPEAALALSLVKRARDLIIGVPALLAWQLVEGRRLGSRRSRRAAASTSRGS
jgi:putative membrane protein